MAREQTTIFLANNVFYKLYKADIGTIIDGRHCPIDESGILEPVERRYCKIDGAFYTDDKHSAAVNGLLRRSQAYKLIFKDLSDGVVYYMIGYFTPAPAPEGSSTGSSFYFYEPSSDPSVFNCMAVSAARCTKTVHVYVPSGGSN